MHPLDLALVQCLDIERVESTVDIEIPGVVDDQPIVRATACVQQNPSSNLDLDIISGNARGRSVVDDPIILEGPLEVLCYFFRLHDQGKLTVLGKGCRHPVVAGYRACCSVYYGSLIVKD